MPRKTVQHKATKAAAGQRPGSEIVPVGESLPRLVSSGGAAAKFAHEEFFHGLIRNPHTRRAYRHAIGRFLRFCEGQGIELRQITPKIVGSYLDGFDRSPATKKQHLSALRNYFDGLVRRHAVVLNPAASVRGERLQVVEGKTPEISVEDARKLLGSINVGTVVGLRDRAVISVLIYTAARAGAVAKLRAKDFYSGGDQWYFRFSEKFGKEREIPVRHDLQAFVEQYITAAGLSGAEKDEPLFRSASGRLQQFTGNGMSAGDIGRMVKRRLGDAGLSTRLSCHSFRVTTITVLLEQGVPLEDVQHLAGHSDPRTTRLYDRRQRRVSRNIVERISI